MISYAFVDGFTNVPREEAIHRLKHAIAAAGGVIIDFAFFGREAVRLSVDVGAGALRVLREELDRGGVELFSGSKVALDEAATMTTAHPIFAMLHLAFIESDDDDRRTECHNLGHIATA